MIRIPSLVVRKFFQPVWDTWESSVRLKTMRELKKNQWDPPEIIQGRANGRLKAMVRYACAHSTFYRDRFLEAGIDPERVESIEDLASLPLLRKSEIRDQLPAILSDEYSKDELVPAKTGGSTGVALNVFCDARGVEKRNGAALLADEWSGWRLGEPVAAVWGNPPVASSWRNKLRWTLKDRVIYLDTMKLNESAVQQFYREWLHMKPGLLYGHAHSIFILAEYMKKMQLTLRPSGIVATSMMLIEQERQTIEEVFGTQVTNRYGCEEVSLIGCECEQHHGMHLNSEHNIVEFLRDDGTLCSPGEDGRIVVTELINFGMPMIRYEVGDRGVPGNRECPCGRGLPMMESITGRVADFLLAQDGSRVAGISLIENTLTRFAGIHQMQLVQDERHHVEAKVVPGETYDAEVGNKLIDTLTRELGDKFVIEVSLVDAIPQESSGKYRFSICKV